MPVILPSIPFGEGLRETANVLAAHFKHDPRTIVLGAHSAACGEPPEDAVIFNTEFPGTFTVDYRRRLARARAVWDHSSSNQRGYEAKHKEHVPLRYHPVLETMPTRPKLVDVGFYGSMNARRLEIISRRPELGRVDIIPFTVGEARDEWIARCRVVVVPHFYEGNGVEQPRIAHLLANGVCVVAEHAPDEDDFPGPFYEAPDALTETAFTLARHGWADVGRDARLNYIAWS